MNANFNRININNKKLFIQSHEIKTHQTNGNNVIHEINILIDQQHNINEINSITNDTNVDIILTTNPLYYNNQNYIQQIRIINIQQINKYPLIHQLCIIGNIQQI